MTCLSRLNGHGCSAKPKIIHTIESGNEAVEKGGRQEVQRWTREKVFMGGLS